MDLQSLNAGGLLSSSITTTHKGRGHGHEPSLGLRQPPSKRLVLRNTVQGKSKVQVEWKAEQLVQIL